MKIAVVANVPDFSRSFAAGATGDTIRYMIRASAYKDAIRIFTQHSEDPYPDLDLDMSPPGMEEGQWPSFMMERLRRYKPDLIEVHAHEKLAAALSRVFRRRPVFFTPHVIPRRRRVFFLKRWLRFSRLNRLICVSDAVGERYAANYHFPAHRMITIRHAVPSARWRGDVQSKERLILFAARSEDYKGFTEYAEGIAKALPALPSWRAAALTVENVKSFRDFRLKVQARYADALGPRCQWIQNASKDETASWMKRAAIFVAPYKCEDAFSLSILEAHLSGAAVISSGRGGTPEVSGKEGALYLEEVSGSAVARAIERLAANDETRQALAKRGQDYVLKHHRIEDRAKALDDLRRKTLGIS